MGKAQTTIKGMFLRGQTWWLRYTPAPGSPQVRESLGTGHAGDAAAKALDILQQAPLERAAEFAVELEAYLEAGLRDARLSPSTVRSRRYALNIFAEVCEASRLAHITPASLDRWLAHLRKGGMPLPSLVTYLTHMQAFCSWLVRTNKLRENPAKKVKLGKVVVVGRKNFQTKDRIRELIAAATDDEMRLILYGGFHAGLRKMEISEARPDWFRLSDGTRRGSIHVQETPTYRPKDKEERTIPLSAEFDTFLRGYLPMLPKGALWVLRPGQKKKRPRDLYRIDFRTKFEEFMARQNTVCTMHDMRRSFVSNKLIDDSSLIFKLAKWTGTDVGTLQKHYAHLLADDEDIEAGL